MPVKASDVIFKEQFEVLFREHFTGLANFSRKFTGDLDSAKEIVHAVFVRIWENRNDFDWGKPAKSYLFTSVYNRSMNHIRDNRKFVRGDDVMTTKDVQVTFNDSYDTSELQKRIDQALLKLPEKCREVFHLSRYHDKKYAEIAETLGISVKTVESQMSKALHILKEELKDYLYILILIMLNNLNG
jgi:RNA polymerase sigma-70 factor (ECF subfamily)